MKWLILWKNNARMGSVELTPDNLEKLRAEFHLMLIQRDAAGHEHYEVLSVKS